MLLDSVPNEMAIVLFLVCIYSYSFSRQLRNCKESFHLSSCVWRKPIIVCRKVDGRMVGENWLRLYWRTKFILKVRNVMTILDNCMAKDFDTLWHAICAMSYLIISQCLCDRWVWTVQFSDFKWRKKATIIAQKFLSHRFREESFRTNWTFF